MFVGNFVDEILLYDVWLHLLEVVLVDNDGWRLLVHNNYIFWIKNAVSYELSGRYQECESALRIVD
jgi:hypothetical protein